LAFVHSGHTHAINILACVGGASASVASHDLARLAFTKMFGGDVLEIEGDNAIE
jgi:hypothetical protein